MGLAAWVEVLHVPGARQLDELNGVACRIGCLRVAAREIDGNHIVGGAMKNKLSDAQREHFYRRSCPKSLRILTRGPTKEFRHRFTSNLELVGAGEVSYRRQPDGGQHTNPW